MTDIATLGIRVNALEAKAAARDLDRLSASATRASTVTERLGRSLKTVGMRALKVQTLAMAVALGNSIRVTAKFDAAISDLSAITGAAGKDLEYLRQQSINFGKTTTLTASQSAEAFKLIASAKPDLLELPKALATVTKEAITLAEATGSTLPEAANTLGQALNQFEADASEAHRFINVLAAGAKFGASEVASTAEALRTSGVAAKAAGLSFEELNGAIQVLSTVGIKASEAGTALRNILIRMSTQTKKEFNPAIVGFSKALRNVEKSSISTADATELFGLRAVNAGRALVAASKEQKVATDQSTASNKAAGDQIDETTTKLDSMIKKVTGTGTAVEQARIKVDNLIGDMKRMASAFEGASIALGDKFTPSARATVQSLQRMFGAFDALITGNAAALKEFEKTITFMTRLRNIVLALVGTYAALKIVPAILAAMSTATKALWVSTWDLAIAWSTGQTAAISFTAALKGSIAATWAAIKANGIFATSVMAVGAAFAGWQVGSMIREEFLGVRVVAQQTVGYMMNAFEEMKFIFNAGAMTISALMAVPFNALGGLVQKALQSLADGLGAIGADKMASDMRAAADNMQPVGVRLGELAGKVAALRAETDAAKAANNQFTEDLIDEQMAAEDAAKGLDELRKEAIRYQQVQQAINEGREAQLSLANQRLIANERQFNDDSLEELRKSFRTREETAREQYEKDLAKARDINFATEEQKRKSAEIQLRIEADYQKKLAEIKQEKADATQQKEDELQREADSNARRLEQIESFGRTRADREAAAIESRMEMINNALNDELINEERAAELRASIQTASAQKYIEGLQAKENAEIEFYERELERLRAGVEAKLISQSEADALTAEIDAARQAKLEEKYLSQEEREMIFYERKLEMLRSAYGAEWEIASEAIDIREEIEKQHQDTLYKLAKKGLLSRKQFAALTSKQQTDIMLGEVVRLTEGVAQNNRVMFNINKAAKMAEVAMNIPSSFSKAYDFGSKFGPGVGALMGGIAAAAQISQLAAIASTSYEGGGGGTTPSAAGSTPVINSTPVQTFEEADETAPNQGSGNAVQIIVSGNVGLTNDMIDEIADGIRTATAERDVVIIDNDSRQAYEIVKDRFNIGGG